MAETYLVGYDGTAASKRALAYAARKAKASGGGVHLVHVLEWSAYDFLSPEELTERRGRRKDELARARAMIQPVITELDQQGVTATLEVRYGHAGELLCEIAEAREAGQIVIGRTGSTSIAARMMGSLALTLVQAAPVPVVVVP